MKSFRPLCVCFVALACAGLATALPYSWDGNGAVPANGNFNVANNWNLNTVPPGSGDTAQFSLGGAAAYTVSFPGSGFLGMNAVNYATDRLLVGSTNAVQFSQVNAFSTYTVNNTTTAEAGRGIIIGQVSGDNATLNTALTGVTGLSGVAATIGDAAGSQGTLNVSGSKFNLSGAGVSNDDLIVGNHGTGTLNVTAVGAVNLTGANGSAILGNYTGSSGTATVSGAGSTWNRNSYFDLIVGLSGTGVLSIIDGGAVVSSNNSIGYLAGSTGTVTVDGADSTWTTLDVAVGLEGTGTMTIKNGGQVNGSVGSIGAYSGSTGVVTVDGAGSKWTNTADGVLGIGTGGSGTLIVSNGGTVSVPSTAELIIGLPGTVKGNGNIVGEVQSYGVVSPGTSSGGLNVPGSLHITGNYTQFASGKLQIELGGNTDYDQLHVNGYLALDGTLQVSLVNSFVPAAGNFFALLTGSWTGAFSTVQLPTLPSGLMWNASQLNAFGILRVTLLGDYNANGVVDAADYLVWRKSLGQTGTALAADGNGNGSIDPGDFNVWRAHFGQTAGSGAGSVSNVAVPEPVGAMLAAMATMTVISMRRRRP